MWSESCSDFYDLYIMTERDAESDSNETSAQGRFCVLGRIREFPTGDIFSEGCRGITGVARRVLIQKS